MLWSCWSVVGLASLLVSGVLSVSSDSYQRCLPKGPGLTIEEFLSGKFYLFERQQAFSIKLLQTAVAASPKQNLIFSPHSIYTALLITYFVSANRTESELKRFLNLPPEQVYGSPRRYLFSLAFATAILSLDLLDTRLHCVFFRRTS